MSMGDRGYQRVLLAISKLNITIEVGFQKYMNALPQNISEYWISEVQKSVNTYKSARMNCNYVHKKYSFESLESFEIYQLQKS